MIRSIYPKFIEKPWGGHHFPSTAHDQLPIGEAWMVSTLPEGEATVDGAINLSQVLGVRLAFMAKILSTSEPLSIQVHPTKKFEASNPQFKEKTECWVVLDAMRDSGIYLGLKTGVDAHQLHQATASKEDVSKYLQFFPAAPGNFFYVPAGTVHALGPGLLLAEFQQASGTTFRVWDWNRPADHGASRELHITEAMACINSDHDKNTIKYFRMIKNVWSMDFIDSRFRLVRHPEFCVDAFSLNKGEKFFCKNKEFILLVEGSIAQGNIVAEGLKAFLVQDDCEIQAKTHCRGFVLSN